MKIQFGEEDSDMKEIEEKIIGVTSVTNAAKSLSATLNISEDVSAAATTEKATKKKGGKTGGSSSKKKKGRCKK